MVCNFPNQFIYQRFFEHHPEYAYAYVMMSKDACHQESNFALDGETVHLKRGEWVFSRSYIAGLLQCSMDAAKSCLDTLTRAGYIIKEKSKKFSCSVYSLPYIKNPVPGTYTSVEIPFQVDERQLKRKYLLPTYLYLAMSANRNDSYDLQAHKVIEEGSLVATTTRIARFIGATVDQVRYVLQQLLELKAIAIEGMRGIGSKIKMLYYKAIKKVESLLVPTKIETPKKEQKTQFDSPIYKAVKYYAAMRGWDNSVNAHRIETDANILEKRLSKIPGFDISRVPGYVERYYEEYGTSQEFRGKQYKRWDHNALFDIVRWYFQQENTTDSSAATPADTRKDRLVEEVLDRYKDAGWIRDISVIPGKEITEIIMPSIHAIEYADRNVEIKKLIGSYYGRINIKIGNYDE